MWIKKIIAALTTIILWGWGSAAFAVAAGLYLGAQLGQSNQHQPVADTTTATDVSNTGLGGRAFLGYQFNPYAGLEGGLTYYTTASYNTSPTVGSTSVKETAFDIMGKGIFPIGCFSIFGKAGLSVLYAQTTTKAVPTSTGVQNISDTATSIHPAAAVGIGYDLSQNWVADVSAMRVFHSGSVPNADLISLGISYHFVDKYCGQFLC